MNKKENFNNYHGLNSKKEVNLRSFKLNHDFSNLLRFRQFSLGGLFKARLRQPGVSANFEAKAV